MCAGSGPRGASEPPSPLWPWCSWEEQRSTATQELFANDRGRLLDQTIEEVSVSFINFMSSFHHIWCLMKRGCYLR